MTEVIFTAKSPDTAIKLVRLTLKTRKAVEGDEVAELLNLQTIRETARRRR